MVITKKSPLSILNHLRVINLTCLKQRFDDCLFQVSNMLNILLINIFYSSQWNIYRLNGLKLNI